MSKKRKQTGLPRLFLKVEMRSRGGLLLHRHYEEAHSFTKNAWIIQQGILLDFTASGAASSDFYTDGAGQAAVDRTGAIHGENRGIYDRGAALAGGGYHNTSENAIHGIVLGLSDDPFSPFRHQVPGLIPHGTDPGQLFYHSMGYPVTTYDDLTLKFTTEWERLFNNNSGGSIDVECAGMIWKGFILRHDLSFNDYLLAHDILPETLTVPDGAQLTVTYEMETIPFSIYDDYAYQIRDVGEEDFGGTILAKQVAAIGPWNYLVLSPKDGGEGSGLNYKTPAESSGPTDAWDGPTNTQTLLDDFDSDIVDFAAAANAAELGGYTDWYVPAYNELIYSMYENRAHIPEGEELEDTNYWSSTRSFSNGLQINWETGIHGGASQTEEFMVRLVRRQNLSDIPAPE